MHAPAFHLRRFHSRLPGFALPLVLLVVLTAGLTVALLMERHGVSYRSINRHVDDYRNHHRAAGIKECVLRWLDTAHGRMDSSIDDDGLAFQMTVRGEGRIDIYMHDAQGSTLSDPSALSGRRREIVEDVKFILDNLPEDMKQDTFFRPVGPPEICLNTAPDIIVCAVCLAVIGDLEKAMQAAKAILDRKKLDDSGSPNILAALSDLSIEEKERREIAAMLVTKPSLYEIVAETRDNSETLLNKSSGLYQIDDSKGNETFKQGGAFLTWDQVPVQ